MLKNLKTFISYSHHDAALLDRLHAHLAMLKRDGAISEWYDREIRAGGTIDSEIRTHLDASDLFLALVSPDFLNSNYCYETEMGRALQRQAAGELIIVPVILEPCDWHSSPLGKLKAVPKDGRAVSEWSNQNSALADVVKELRRLATVQQAHTDSPPAPRPSTPKQQPGRPAAPTYRVKRAFDEIDRTDFRRGAYQMIREYFENQVAEINALPGIRARNEDISGVGFSCLIINQNRKQHGPATITIRAGGNSLYGSVMGDIYYSFQPNAPENVSNGGFRVEADEYQLYLSWTDFTASGRGRKWTPQDAAAQLWSDLMAKAGISPD